MVCFHIVKECIKNCERFQEEWLLIVVGFELNLQSIFLEFLSYLDLAAYDGRPKVVYQAGRFSIYNFIRFICN